ncbi:LysM peptidoglycan-binding domain-containing protein [Microbacterium sp. No. 7]|uniref:LysM peptidoglycan-binding domain-containing protein n=1 Tax=Microbacterium sp. No. 7 TaxID=1714373 RepID=UPI0006D021A3|nr:LysM peptidoglycan-binding domain-containing protein [Microbacterium sp. No. 7]ALJ21018.1 hypothetical protein AOA12_14370 [Microbacterium sp. No. 7]
MSTIDIAGPRPVVVRTRLRLTTRGRRVLVALASAPVVVAVSIAMLSGGGAVASSERPADPASFETVTVQPGDTLWSLAGEIAPDADPRDVIDAIMRLNALSSARLDVGQSIALPLEYTPGR